MEDGSDDTVSSAVISPPINNGEIEVMANFPNADTDCSSPLKVNGDTNLVESQPEVDEKDSSDCDALVIDESANPPKKKRIKTFGPEEEFTHTNPYFSESIFDLSTQYNKTEEEEGKKEKVVAQKKVQKVNGKKLRGKNGKPKLREYAQYLGLQPTVQFKCSKCGSSGFQSLQSLNEHLTNCTSRVPINPPAPLSNNTTNFRVTRKVFLCSACGTYYENWNLFLHMREVHKRFICLYCLGMFPHAEKLSLHLISKHNCAPGRFETKHDFFGAYKEPCFLMCCDCQTVFNEQEDFINHECIESVKETVSEQDKPKLTEEIKTEPSECLTNQEVSEESINKETDCDVQTNQNLKTIETSEDLGVLKQMSDLNMLVEEREDVNTESNNHCDVTAESESKTLDDNPVDISEDTKSVVDGEEKSVHEDEDKCVQDEEEKSVADEEDKTNVDDEHLNDNEDESFENLEPEESNNADSSQNLEQDNVEEKGEDNCEDMDQSDDFHPEETPEELRKVPKVTLKLPKISNYNPNDEEEEYQSEDSEKLTMEVEKVESDLDMSIDPPEEETENCKTVVEEETKNELAVPTAGSDIAIIELELEQALDKCNIQLLLQKCLRATIGTCLYCNHARKICVNGKQLGLHAIAEHRYSAINKSITAEELIPESFNSRIKESLEELEKLYFNLESTSSEGGVTFSHIFECFQCRYSSNVHKELYLHNRKLHAKAILLCIMCKMSFYSYSELICHLCPGIYSLDKDDIHFRCCLCVSGDIPSAFRLMVHLRKKHHVCDVCLEMCHNQSRLSNHIWKHKLHHFCYRCGIAYRNKPDITKHLFWKHGTESVLCKKCLQKKWPHMYHFCIPPTNFACEECNLTFTKAVSLKVHKRIHKEEFPHVCTEEGCTEKFISKKLLAKHEFRHRQPIEEPKKEEEVKLVVESQPESKVEANEEEQTEKTKTSEEVEVEEKEKPKPKVDVYDLPELNLSESDSSESEDEEKSKPSEVITKTDLDNILDVPNDGILKTDEPDDAKLNGTEDKHVPVLENIWDDFKNYQANIAKLDILTDVGKDPDIEEPKILTDIPAVLTLEVALRDHDYCAPTMDTLKEQDGIPQNLENSADHDYCSANEQKDGAKIETPSVPTQNNQKLKNKNLSSDSSSDSDSSSCTCGSNCSCSSSSDSSSSTSDSSESDSSSEEGRRRQQVRREKRRQKKVKQPSESAPVDVVSTDNPVVPPPVISTPSETPIRESDLDTTETDTDEEFYDKEPQKIASKLLAEKREKLQLAAAAGNTGNYINGSIIDSRPSTPSLPEEAKPKKKSKSKKKKKKKSSKHDSESIRHTDIPLPAYPTVAPITLSIPKNSPTYAPVYSPNVNTIPNILNLPQNSNILSETDSNTRASKRRRVPNKFYGYSSDEEAEKANSTLPNYKFRKVDLPSPVVPPLTIKAPPTPTVEPISIRMTAKSGEMRVQPLRLPFPKRTVPKLKPMKPRPIAIPPEAGSDSNSSSSEDEAAPKIKEQPALYCYCRCPYDEVSEMIGCDADDCAIEWFHFECVGIMVPPKGQWYCPDCRKKKQQRRDMLQAQMS